MFTQRELLFFWRHVDQAGPHWLWTGSTNSDGYGYWRCNNQLLAVHRVSWIIHFGSIPVDLDVLHSCDIRPCIYPQHLFLGTHQDNMHDMAIKGRAISHSGSANGNAILTEDLVREIKVMLASNVLTRTAIAKQTGVSVTTISRIALGRTWSQIRI